MKRYILRTFLAGLWPNVLTNSSSFSETSASGMFLTAFITGMERGWLDVAEFEQSVRVKFNLEKTVIAVESIPNYSMQR